MVRTARIGKEYYDHLQTISQKGWNEETSNFFKKALTSTAANSGREHIPEAWASEIIREVYERSWHRQVFNTYIMSTIKEHLPKFTDRWKGQYIASPITSTDPANQLPLQSTSNSTGEREIELKTLTINLVVDNKYLVYNASPQIESILREDLVNAMMETELDAVINGDDTTTHQDADVTDETDARKAFKGLRKLATGVVVDCEGNAFTYGYFNRMLRNMNRYARGQYQDLALFVSPGVAAQIRLFPELVTLEKYGPNASVVAGEIGKLSQVTVIELDDEYIREDLNASGVHSGTTADDVKTIAILVNTKKVWLGVPRFVERTLSIKKWDDPRFDRVQLIALEDFGFQVSHPDAVIIAKDVDPTIPSGAPAPTPTPTP